MEDSEPPVLNYADPRPEKWVAIALFPDEMSAHLASSKLDAEGIKTLFGNEVNPIAGNNSTGICVQSHDVKAAVAILADSPAKRWLVG